MSEGKEIRLSDKLFLYSIIIELLAIIITGTVAFRVSKEAVMDRTFDQLTSLRVVKTRQLESFFDDRKSEVDLISNSSEVAHLLDFIFAFDYSDGDTLKISNNESSAIRLPLNNAKSYNSIIFSNTNNELFKLDLRTSDSMLKVVQFKDDEINDLMLASKEYKGARIIDDFKKTKFDYRGVLIAAGGLNSGHVIFEVSRDAIDKIMLETDPQEGLGLSGESYLVGADKLMRSTSRFLENSFLNTIVETDVVDDAMNNRSGSSIIEDYRGIHVLSSYSKLKINGLDWVILVEIDQREATVPIIGLRNSILVISLIISIVVFIATFLLSKGLTRPLKALIVATERLGKGEYEQVKVEDRSDEIGELSKTYNHMIEELNEKNRELEDERTKRVRAMIDGQEYERRRLSREIHDSIGQMLIAGKLGLESISTDDDPDKINHDLSKIKDSMNDTIEEARRISNNLLPAVLHEFGLRNAIRLMCEEAHERTKIDINCSLQKGDLVIDETVKTYIFRITQEALNNIVKHSEARNIDIDLKLNENNIILRVEDNGVGFDTDIIKDRNRGGLLNIQERVNLCGGELKVLSTKNIGTRIEIMIPLNKTLEYED